MADKLLLLGEHYKEQNKTKISPGTPKVGMLLGQAHTGIEDLLYLGRPALQNLILTIYEPFLKEVLTEKNIHYFPKVRVIKYNTGPEDEVALTDEDLLKKLYEKFPQYKQDEKN